MNRASKKPYAVNTMEFQEHNEQPVNCVGIDSFKKTVQTAAVFHS